MTARIMPSARELDLFRERYPLSVSRTVSSLAVERFAEYVLREACPEQIPDWVNGFEREWIHARRGALRLGGVYVALERGVA